MLFPAGGCMEVSRGGLRQPFAFISSPSLRSYNTELSIGIGGGSQLPSASVAPS